MVAIKAQYSMEFILIFAFSILIILPFIHMINSEYMERKGQLDESQASQVLEEIEIAAANAYYSGYPSRTTLELVFPGSISTINCTQVTMPDGKKSEIVFVTKAGKRENNLVAVFPFTVNATLKPSSGRRKILIKAEKADYVNITDVQ